MNKNISQCLISEDHMHIKNGEQNNDNNVMKLIRTHGLNGNYAIPGLCSKSVK